MLDSKDDYRFPLFRASWARASPAQRVPATDSLDEPHIKRKTVILRRHPQVYLAITQVRYWFNPGPFHSKPGFQIVTKITGLYGPEHKTKYFVLLCVIVQLSVGALFARSTPPIWLFAATVYILGASITQMCGTFIHEAAHGLTAKSMLGNRLVAFVANIAIPFPIAASFRRYHLEHHAYQGVEGKDPDLPLAWEAAFLAGGPLSKATFLFLYPLMYVGRGLAMQKTPSAWEVANVFWTIATNYLVYTLCGPVALLYLFCSLWFGYGIHPGAAHFVQEHFTWADGQETYSYYGSLNKIFFNIGYHNEHHDFTKVPWTKIKSVREIAPEFYNNLHFHMSWTMVLWDFIFDSKLGPQSRLSRTFDSHKLGRKLPIPADVEGDLVEPSDSELFNLNGKCLEFLKRVDSGNVVEKDE